jgi:hypothetical protein
MKMNRKLLLAPVVAGVMGLALTACGPFSGGGPSGLVAHPRPTHGCIKIPRIDGGVTGHPTNTRTLCARPPSGQLPYIAVGSGPRTITYYQPTEAGGFTPQTVTYTLDQWLLTQQNPGPQPCATEDQLSACINLTGPDVQQFLRLQLTITNPTGNPESALPPGYASYDTNSLDWSDVTPNIPIQSGMGPAEGTDSASSIHNTVAGDKDLVEIGDVNAHSTITDYITYIVPKNGEAASLIYTLNDPREGEGSGTTGGFTGGQSVLIHGTPQLAVLSVVGPGADEIPAATGGIDSGASGF